jgi:hypothetical protein
MNISDAFQINNIPTYKKNYISENSNHISKEQWEEELFYPDFNLFGSEETGIQPLGP